MTIKIVGHIDLELKLLADVVTAIKRDTDPRHQDLLKGAMANFAKNPRCSNDLISKTAGSLTLTIPPDCLTPGEARYVMYYSDRIDRLVESPLKTVVLKIADAIRERKFFTNHVEVNFENGCIFSAADFWHKDSGSKDNIDITVCFSNKPNWSTRVVDHDDPEDPSLDSRSSVLPHGDLLDARHTTHRAPKVSDFPEDPVTSKDWRLFFRFSSK